MRNRWIETFIQKVLPIIVEKVKPTRVVLFGSGARGEAGEDSDIDIIVISNHFKGVPFLKRMPLLLKLIQFKKHVDFLCYTEEEFEHIKETSSIVKQALEEGIEIFRRKKTDTFEDVKRIIKNKITKVIEESGYTLEKIILFGSRARGDYSKESDWDCMVIVDKKLTQKEKRIILARIKMELARLKIPNDVIIKSSADFEREKRDVGYLSYYVHREGVEL